MMLAAGLLLRPSPESAAQLLHNRHEARHDLQMVRIRAGLGFRGSRFFRPMTAPVMRPCSPDRCSGWR